MKNKFYPPFNVHFDGLALGGSLSLSQLIMTDILQNTILQNVKYEMISLIRVSRETNEICCSDVILHSETLQWKLVFLEVWFSIFPWQGWVRRKYSCITAKGICEVSLHLWDPNKWKAKVLLYYVYFDQNLWIPVP